MAPVPAGSTILVEFVGASQWYNASLTIAAGWIRTGGVLAYDVFAQPPDNIRSQLKRLGIDVNELERADRLGFTDGYSATLGHKSKEESSYDSLKIVELSIEFSRGIMRAPPRPEKLIVVDNESTYARFNDEKAFVEFLLTRHFPSHGLRKSTGIIGILRGVHSGWVYEQLEAAVEGIIDFKLEEVADKVGEQAATIMRIRSMRDIPFDARWHRLKVGENFEVTLEK